LSEEKEINITDMYINKSYSNEEIEIIRHYYPIGGANLTINYLPHRTIKGISEKARTLHIKSNNKHITYKDGEIEIIKLHYPIGGADLVLKHLQNRSRESIFAIASKLKIKSKVKYFSKYDDDIIRQYYPKNGFEEVIKYLPERDKSSIQQRAHKLGVNYLSYDEYYFNNIDNSEKAYWLGFLYADGYVTTNNRWGLQLAIKDLSHMENFLKCLQCNVNIKKRFKISLITNKYLESCGFMIHNLKMYNDLYKYGVVNNKTYCLKFPSINLIPDKLLSHFIRGYFDGDGSITYYLYDRIRKDRNNQIQTDCNYKEISLVCKSLDFILQMQTQLKYKCDVNFKLNINCRDDLYVLRLYKLDELIKFINYIYQDIDNSYYLERKYLNAQNILNLRLV
jgi:hypothetical protein